jgi:GMP synthase (glutamine-hydrolysing)
MFDPEKFISEKVEEAKKTITGNAIIAVSGGVDSSVAAAIVAKAIGERLTAVHVDNGFMRKHSDEIGESEWVVASLKKVGVNAILVDAEEQFLNARLDMHKIYPKGIPEASKSEMQNDGFSKPLKEVVEPEVKRKIIGEQFIRVFEKEARKVNAKFLIQGTLAPDWIESGGGIRDNIKSHHNVGGLPPDMGIELYEPNHELYKDEVRKVARALGLPEELSERQPFPGPALAIRIIGPPNKENTAIVREANYIWEQVLENAFKEGRLDKMPEQYLTGYFPDLKTVGVHGDVRCHGGAIGLRAFKTLDFMSGQASNIPFEILEEASIKITNVLKEKVNRVFYDVTHKPPGTTEFE